MAISKGFGVAMVFLIEQLFVSGVAFGHGGGLNAAGCHTNRKTGEYHCHRSSYERPPTVPSQSTTSPKPAPLPPSNLISQDAYSHSVAPLIASGETAGLREQIRSLTNGSVQQSATIERLMREIDQLRKELDQCKESP